MATVFSKPLLKAVYNAVLSRAHRHMPTTWTPVNTIAFHYFPRRYAMVDSRRQIFTREKAMESIKIYKSECDGNRFTGMGTDSVESAEGLYCALQQQAIVNEVAHYVNAEDSRDAAMNNRPAPPPRPRGEIVEDKGVVKIETLVPVDAVDISPHNIGAQKYVNTLAEEFNFQRLLTKIDGRRWSSVWDAIHDEDDCSAARGFGLAVAKLGYLAMRWQTVRMSERSLLERGDNILFFGKPNQILPYLRVLELFLFPPGGERAGVQRFKAEY